MDSVRFGRALGIGTRLAAKTLAEAVDAAIAPNPSAKAVTTTPAARTEVMGARTGEQVRRTTTQVKRNGRGLKEGGKRFWEAVAEPFVRLSGVLWLEVTGVFFGIFALSAGIAMWKQRGSFYAASGNHDARLHFFLLAGVAVMFGYFFVSSFVKAHLRSRKR